MYTLFKKRKDSTRIYKSSSITINTKTLANNFNENPKGNQDHNYENKLNYDNVLIKEREIQIKPDTETKSFKPYHERVRDYIVLRSKLFSDPQLGKDIIRKYKRSTVRMRNFYKKIRNVQRKVISSIVNSEVDGRLYAEVYLLNKSELGLLDTGANISCIGKDLATTDFSQTTGFHKINSHVKTADGKEQNVIGFIELKVKYKNLIKEMIFYIVPTLKQRLILGLDFWKKFGLMNGFISNNSLQSVNNHVESIEGESYPLTFKQQQQLEVVKSLFPNFETDGLGKTSLLTHSIDVGNSKPVKQRFYPVSPAVEKLIFEEVDRMLSLGVIEPSTSPWSSPMRMVIKPGKVRLCLDARRINEVTQKDAYPLPNIQGILSRLPQANIISKIDLKDAYWQVPLEEKSKPITAFTIPGRPLYQFTVMPFGLCNAAQTMCRLMDQIIPPELKYCVFGYLDDVCVVSDSIEAHLLVLARLAEQFRKANLTLNLAKSKFCVKQARYLGYIIGDGGISTDPEKINSILNWPIPKTLKQVRGFLGLSGWYRRFILNFADVTHPITEILSKKKKFEWTPAADEAFRKIKHLLTTAPVLKNPDFSKKFYIHCDASDFGIGAVLVQLDEERNENPIAFMSRKLNSAQRNYSVTEKECLAAIEAIERFRCYIELQEFEIITDHNSLLWLMKQPNLKGRLARWALKMQGYSFSISHRKGKDNIVPDALSRLHESEIYSIEDVGPEVDLESPEFLSSSYIKLKNKFLENSQNFPDVKVVDHYIYTRLKFSTGNEDLDRNNWKLWIPEGLRKDILKRFHNSPTAAHGGISKTLELIRRNFFWPRMVSDVREYVSSCETCKVTKPTNKILRPEMGQMTVVERPFQRIFIDLLGPYPRSRKGFIGIFIVLDNFSKYHWLCPLKKFSSTNIIDFLERQIFHHYGVPEIVMSDNGSQFKANDFNKFLEKYGIHHTYTALYSPQSNASERVNRSIICAIRAYIKKDHRDWDANLSQISCALRNSYHHSIGLSPYHALYGYDMITHGSSYKLLKSIKSLSESSIVLSRDDQLSILRDQISENLRKAYETNVRTYNLRARTVTFSIGQIVYRKNFAQSDATKNFNAKLCPRFIKARVKQKIGNCYYVLEDLDGENIATYHAKDIKT